MKLLKEEITHIGFIGKGSFKKKKVIEFKSERAAKVWLTKNAPKYHNSGIDKVGYIVKDQWDKDPYTESTINKDMSKAPTIKKSIWDKLHSDYKGVRNGVHYMLYLDKKSGATIYGPVKIVESISEKKVPKKGSVDFNQHKIAVDTLKNPNKGLFMGGPSAKEAEETLMKKFGYTTQEINKLKESVNEYDEWRNTRIQAKNIFRMLKQKYNNNIPKMKDGLEDIFKQNKTKNDQADVVRSEFNKYFKLKESVNEAKMSDALFVADQLVNGVDQGHLDKREFISHLSKETSYGKNELGKVFDAWDKLDFREKDDLGFSNRDMLQWLKKFGIKESVTESTITRTAVEIGALTGVNKDFIQKFVDTNKLDIEKLYDFVKKGKLKDRMDFVTAISGNSDNKYQKMIISKFGIKEGVKKGK